MSSQTIPPTRPPLAVAHTVLLLGSKAERVRVAVYPPTGGFEFVGATETQNKEAFTVLSQVLRDANLFRKGFQLHRLRIEVTRVTDGAPLQDREVGINIYSQQLMLPAAVAIASVYRPQINRALSDAIPMFIGSMSTDGKIHPVRGQYVMMLDAPGHEFFVSDESASLAESWRSTRPFISCSTFSDVLAILEAAPGSERRATTGEAVQAIASEPYVAPERTKFSDFILVLLANSAANRRPLLLVGPPGAGQILLARLLPSFLPVMSTSQAIETARIQSIAGIFTSDPQVAPFRAPHHTASMTALMGTDTRPGECSLAHNGVLLLAGINDFSFKTVEAILEVCRAREVHGKWKADFKLIMTLETEQSTSDSTERKLYEKYGSEFDVIGLGSGTSRGTLTIETLRELTREEMAKLQQTDTAPGE